MDGVLNDPSHNFKTITHKNENDEKKEKKEKKFSLEI